MILNKNSPATHFAWLSITAAVFTIVLKLLAYYITGSVGLLSDAMESFINLAGALMALWMLTIALRPADEDHAFGHSKAEYFSSGVEGILILIAAIFIGIASVERFINPRPIEQVGAGLLVSVLASIINLVVALILFRAAKTHHSITLESDAKHLMTDVWTSAGVIVGVGLVAVTGYNRLDPIVAFAVACNIVWSGISIIRKSVAGLMDEALPASDQLKIQKVLDEFRCEKVEFHAILSRQAGARRFVSLHVLVPGSWTVMEGHDLLEKIESGLRSVLPGIVVITHLEPLEDPSSYTDMFLG